MRPHLFVLVLAAILVHPLSNAAESIVLLRAEAARQEELGNVKTATELYRQLALDRSNTPKDTAGDIQAAVEFLLGVDNDNLSEAFLDDALAVWTDSWRVLAKIALLRMELPDNEMLYGGRYVRVWGFGTNTRSTWRQDVKFAVSTMLQAEKLLDSGSDPASREDKAAFYRQFANMLPTTGTASLDADGNPHYDPMPSSWDAASNNTERWRWLLGKWAEYGDQGDKDETDWLFAKFLAEDHDVSTIWSKIRKTTEQWDGDDAYALEVRTLSDYESMAWIDNDVRRFALPDEFNHIRILRRLSLENAGEPGRRATGLLAQIYENRQQFDKAAEFYRRLVASTPGDMKIAAEERLENITGNIGKLWPVPPVAAGTRPSIPYRYRNVDRVVMTARLIDEKRVFADLLGALQGDAEGEIGRGLHFNSGDYFIKAVTENTQRYTKLSHTWEVVLKPHPDHHSGHTFIEIPIDTAGCYLVEAALENGNTARTVVRVADMVLVTSKKGGDITCFVADAKSGEPMAHADVTAYTYDKGVDGVELNTFPATADANGLAMFSAEQVAGKTLFLTAETDDGKHVLYGADTVYTHGRSSERGEAAFVITDRPVYRPNQKINFKIWLGQGSYTAEQQRYRAGERIAVSIKGPHDAIVYEKTLTTDAYGGANDSLVLDENAPLGSYSFFIGDKNNYSSFRLEEYKKDEYRPGDTVKLAVNSENPTGTVLLFVHSVNSSQAESPPPRILKLENGMATVDIPITNHEQPWFTCDAVTVFDGKVYTESREVFVPPADKALSVAVRSDKEKYLPGEKASFAIEVTDINGKPATGQCAVSLYDKAIDFVNCCYGIGDIHKYFWRRYRGYPFLAASSLERSVYTDRNSYWEFSSVGRYSYYINASRPSNSWNDGNENTTLLSSDRFKMSSKLNVDMPRPSPFPSYSVGGMQAAPFADDQPALLEAHIRETFADSAFWIPALDLDAEGKAAFSLEMPENLTTWQLRAWVMGPETQTGDGEATVVTRKNIIVRPQTPRFLVQGDEAVLSANLHNYLPAAKAARAELRLEGDVLEFAEKERPDRSIDISAGGRERTDWRVRALRPGKARIVMKLLTDEESDAAAVTLPVVIHGSRIFTPLAGALAGDESETVIRFSVPEQRSVGQSRLELALSPSVAVAMLDALPYLLDYPYGCTEQTLNRFLPAVMTRAYLDRLGRSLSEARSADTPHGILRIGREKFGDTRPTPVFDDAKLAALVGKGVNTLADMQNRDGGWGWFSGEGEQSWPHTTAVVVYGLLAAREHGAAVPDEMMDKGIAWLEAYRSRQMTRLETYRDGAEGAVNDGKAEADNMDAFVQLILAEAGKPSPSMRDRLFRDRRTLSLSALSMLGMLLFEEHATDDLAIVLQNIEQYLEEGGTPGGVRLRIPGKGWLWHNDAVETHAWYLKLLSKTDPRGAKAAGIARHLLRNRKNGAYWRSTRDTAYAVEALADYAAASGESAPDMAVSVYLDGNMILERSLTAENILEDIRLVLEGPAIETGEHEIRIVRGGSGALHYGGGLAVFSLDDPIKKAGGELKIERRYYKLSANADAETDRLGQGQGVCIPTPLAPETGGEVFLEPGDQVEVELRIEADDDYEYLVFEDMKAAGCEAEAKVSGYGGNRLGAYVEYRDQKVVLFIRRLPAGNHTMSYRLRAVTPGAFSVLPVFGGGMYATDLFANSDELKVRIIEEDVHGNEWALPSDPSSHSTAPRRYGDRRANRAAAI